MKYRVGVYEVWEQMYEVEAESEAEAIDKINIQECDILEDQFAFVELSVDPYRFYDKSIE